MYIVIASIFIIILIYFSSTIYSVIASLKTNTNSKLNIGSKWFVSLLIINIIMIIFILLFYYYKSQSIGNKGPIGKKGFDGQSGEPCVFTIANNKCK